MGAPLIRENPPVTDPFHVLSLRDPDGQLLYLDGRVLRLIHRNYLPHLERITQSPALAKFISQGQFIESRSLAESEWRPLASRCAEQIRISPNDIGAAVEHPPIWFPSFPHEWAPQMLLRAGELTLELAIALSEENMGLKDATPFNVLFLGPKPVFVDYLSVEPREPKDPVWIPFSQFLGTFVNPLLANREFGIPLSWIFLANREGLSAEALYPMFAGLRKFSPGIFSQITLPTWLSRRQQKNLDDDTPYQKRLDPNPEKAKFIFLSILRQLQKKLRRNRPKAVVSTWSDYTTTDYSFTQEQYGDKVKFVEATLQERKPKTVLDIGCNTGDFSFLASDCGAKVVSVDYDSEVIGRLWERAHEKNANILPLVVNLARPSPGLGWKNTEVSSFINRAEKKFEGVMMLAVIHHLMVTEGIPLQEILRLAASLSQKWVLVEFISHEDRAFHNLCRGRDFSFCTQDWFESQVQSSFEIAQVHPLPHSHRWLYVLELK